MIIDNLEYDPDTGHFTRVVCITKPELIGKRAGTLHKRGYRHVYFQGKEWKEHRLAFLFMGEPIPKEVDHVNRIKDDNRWCNLRPASRSLNCTNQGIRKDNIIGLKGISFDDNNKYSKWIYRVQVNKVKEHYSFKTLLDAAAFKLSRERTL